MSTATCVHCDQPATTTADVIPPGADTIEIDVCAACFAARYAPETPTPAQVAQRDAENEADAVSDLLADGPAPVRCATCGGVDGSEGPCVDCNPLARREDIPTATIVRAYSGVSFVPEKRAQDTQTSYVAEIHELYFTFLPLATTDELRAKLLAHVLAYKARYRRHVLAMLAAKSRVVSTMIAGPSGFPARTMQKRANTEHKRLDELLDFRERARAAIRRDLVGPSSISSDLEDAPELLAARRDRLVARHERMVETNKAWRIKDGARRVAALEALGYDESAIAIITAKTSQPHPGYQLTNSSATIKRIEQRIFQIAADRAAQRAMADAVLRFAATDAHPAGRLFVEENRVCLAFEERTSRAFYSSLRGRGFLWSPTREAFVRKYTADALSWAKQLVGIA